MSILYKNARNANFVLFMKTSNRWILKYGLENFDLEEYQKSSVRLLQAK